MPLEFDTLNHGKIAFGFFNIETDMILLEHHFFFAQEFCRHISESAQVPSNEAYESSFDSYLIENHRDIGNLMGAIHGVDFRGFIGEVYKLFPFPEEREKFKQNPEGFKTRIRVEKLIQEYGQKATIQLLIPATGNQINIGDYLFNRNSFQELIKYVWMGGFPRWKDGIGPDYVLEMKQAIEQSKRRVFNGLSLE
jgi:hypothetical protein